MKIGKNTESYDFFEKVWDVGKYSNQSENKEFFLNVGIEIFQCLKTHTYDELKQPLNEFYKFLGKIPNNDELKTLYNKQDSVTSLCQNVMNLADNLINKYSNDESIKHMVEKCTLLVIDDFNQQINNHIKNEQKKVENVKKSSR